MSADSISLGYTHTNRRQTQSKANQNVETNGVTNE